MYCYRFTLRKLFKLSELLHRLPPCGVLFNCMSKLMNVICNYRYDITNNADSSITKVNGHGHAFGHAIFGFSFQYIFLNSRSNAAPHKSTLKILFPLSKQWLYLKHHKCDRHCSFLRIFGSLALLSLFIFLCVTITYYMIEL